MDAAAVLDVWQGWQAYAMHANTYLLRERMGAGMEAALARTDCAGRNRPFTPG